ncbi:MAG: PASTA domain-containing protein [Clostridiales bacterium]|nr:PASTA domain-containing protein [Clostridiales bacterium]
MAKAGKKEITTKAPTRQMWRRSVVVLVILIGFCFTAITGRLAVLQIAQGDEWQQKAVSQQLSDSIISPKRGSIYDTNMTPLAQSATVWTVIMSPKDIPDDATRQKIADELSVMLNVDHDKLLEKTQKVSSQYEVVKSKIELALRDTLSDWIQNNKLTGVFRVIEDYKRYYPNATMLSPVLGFTGTDNYGLYGLEAYYEETLAGKPGRIVTAKNGWGDDMPTALKFEKTVDAEDGNSLVLTIDSVVQRYAEKYLANAVKEVGATNRGAAIVMDVNTGAVLAMATEGGFDLNDPMTIANPDTAAAIAQLAGDEQADALKAARQAQWVNKPISDFYEPGSVFKVFTASMALEEGVVDESTTFNCGGFLMRGGARMNCHKTSGHGLQTFPKCISNSCNPAFIQIGERVGAEAFFKYFTGFGFTEKTGIDMLSESKVTDILYHDANELGESQLAASSFGQTFKVTPIQMITAMCAAANGGKLMQPYVVKQVIDSDGNVVKNVEPVVKRQVISSDTSSRMAKILADAVNGGGSKNAYVAGYRVAGKTGTSDKTDQKVAEGVKKDVVASFSGFAPADDPQVAILVLLDEPHAPVNFGGTISAPVAQKVLADALPYLGIEPVYTEEELANMNRTTPDVKDKEVSAAQNMITNSSLNYTVVGTGSTVLRQVPEAGSSIPKNGTVVLYTEESGAEKKAVVPDFNGKTLSQANQAAAAANINLQISGVMSGADNVGTQGEAKGGSQNIAAGTEVEPGTVVEVKFIYEDNIA